MPRLPEPPIPVEVLLLAYRSGIFPMADDRDDPEVFWVEPRDRAIIPLNGFRCSRSLRKTLRQDRFQLTCDTAFAQVMEECAAPRAVTASDQTPGSQGSWISHRIADSYLALHHAGHAHSIECWVDGPKGAELAGGLYGVAFDRVFCGESMFSRRDDTSKAALALLVWCMKNAGYVLLDCQFMTSHLATLGAIELKQSDYLAMVAAANGEPRLSLPEAYASLSSLSSGFSSGPPSESGASSALPSPGKLIAQSFTQTS